MKKLLIIFLLPFSVFAWDFTQERNTIPVYFDSVRCQVPWTTGYNYIQPTFCDIDGDNDFDLFIGSDWNRMSFYSNIGDSSFHRFIFETDTIVNLPFPPEPRSQRTCRPAFCDIDNDNDQDLIVGGYYRLFYYQNIGTINYPVFSLVTEYFQNISLVGDQYPAFVDLDNDNDYDLFIGFGYISSNRGKMAFYRNDGSPDSVSMVLITDYFMNIDLGYYCIPTFTDIDSDGDYDMFLGDENGNIHFYRNDGTPQQYNFTLVSQQYQGINVGRIASPAFCDIDGDGDYDLFVGERSWGEDNRHGDIDFYENVGRPDSAVFQLVTKNFVTMDIGKKPYPSLVDIDNDGLKDMLLGDTDGNINYFSNIGTVNNPQFTLTEERFQNITAAYQSRPTFGDLDGDNDLDLIIGRTSMFSSSLYLYSNDGTPAVPNYVLISSNYLGIDYAWPAPRLADIDADGDLDLFVGHLYNQLTFWENIGTPNRPRFELNTPDFLNTQYTGEFCPVCFGDIDNDGDLDILRGHFMQAPYQSLNAYLDYYQNIGTATSPNLILSEPHFLGIESFTVTEPYLDDIDSDSDLDLFVSDWCGGVCFWRNNEINGVVNKPRFTPCAFALGQNYPNPFNAITTIPLRLERALPVRVVVYNQLGQRVETLFEGKMSKGTHRIHWDGARYGSGVYFISLGDERGMRGGRKVMLVK